MTTVLALVAIILAAVACWLASRRAKASAPASPARRVVNVYPGMVVILRPGVQIDDLHQYGGEVVVVPPKTDEAPVAAPENERWN